MMTVIITLIRYEDWVWSHPDPALVRNYMIPGGNAYKPELAGVTELVRKGWHTDPSPTEIDWIGVTLRAKPLHLIDGRRVRVDGRAAYMPAALNILINQKISPYLNDKGVVAGHSNGGGRTAFSITLSQGSDGRWRISDIDRLNLSAGMKGLAK
jgi:hypothetical protein